MTHGLQESERALYGELWGSVADYGTYSPGEAYLPLFLSEASPGTVLDAGCGGGKASVLLASKGYTVTLCDLTDAGLCDEARALSFRSACLWHDLRPLTRVWRSFDYVYCCDVLEHLPTQFTLLAVDQMLRVTRSFAFFGVALVPDSFGAWTGQPLHKTVQSFVWWRDAIREVGEVIDARDLHETAIFRVRPRR